MLVETEIPVGKPGVHAPIVTPDIVTVYAPAATKVVVVRTTELKPIPPLIDADKPASCVGVPLKKPFGYVSVTVLPVTRAVAVAKLNEMFLPVAPGTRSPGWIVRATPVTWPPSAPDAVPFEA